MSESVRTVAVEAGPIEVWEAGAGRPIVFLHGALSNRATWAATCEGLARSFRCVAPTLPLGGHRTPMSPSADLSPAGIAGLIRALADALGLASFTLVGNDTGGAYAQAFAAAYPDRVEGLVLSGCDALDVFPPARFASLAPRLRVPLYADLMALAFRSPAVLSSQSVMGVLSNRLTGAELRRGYVDGFIRDRGVREDFRRVAQGWSPSVTEAAADELATLGLPTLLVWGADDVLFPLPLARRLHARLPGSELVVVPDARTYVQVDQPEAFAAHVSRFASSLVG